jgi:prepilin-type processing-associated H-X9-DG protein
MAEVPPYSMPEAPQPAPKKSNTLVWVLVIVGVGGMCLVIMVVAAILFPVFSQAKAAAQRTRCQSNLKQLANAQLLYTADFDDRFPLADGWDEAISPYSQGAFACPLVEQANLGRSGYAFNEALQKKKAQQISSLAGSILLFESQDTALGKFGGEEDLKTPGRHPLSGGGNNFVYCDGSVKFVRDTDDPGLWKP